MKIDFICVGCSLLPLLSLRTSTCMLIVFCNQTTLKLDKIEILANFRNFKFLELGNTFQFCFDLVHFKEK